MRALISEPARLAEAATWVARNLRLRSTEPIYGSALLSTGEAGVVVEGFDTTTATRFQVPAETSEPGMVLVSARLLADVARLLPHRPVELRTTGTELAVVCGGSRARLPLMPVEEYPNRPTVPAVSWWCPAEPLVSAVVRVVAAASTDLGQTDLTCVALDLPADGELLRLYATDRANMAAARVPTEPAGTLEPPTGRVLVQAGALEPAARALAGDPGGRIGLGTTGRTLVLETATRRVTLATVDRPGHDYERILAAIAGEEFVATRAELEAALKRVALHKDAPKARIDCQDNELRIGVRGQHGTTQEALAVDYTGQPVTVGMFTHRLSTALHHLGGDLTHFTIPPDPSRPWLLRPVTDEGHPDDTYRHVVIPAKLSAGEEAVA